MIKGIFFDFDGVLTTDKTGSLTETKYFASKLGMDVDVLLEKRSSYSCDNDLGRILNGEAWEFICKELSVVCDPNWINEAFASTPVDDKMLDYARELKRNYRVGIITDQGKQRAVALNKMHNLDELFDPIIVSAVVKMKKDATEIFEVASAEIGLKPRECIFIDNKRENVGFAQNAGMVGIYFDDEERDYEKLFKEIKEAIE